MHFSWDFNDLLSHGMLCSLLGLVLLLIFPRWFQPWGVLPPPLWVFVKIGFDFPAKKGEKD